MIKKVLIFCLLIMSLWLHSQGFSPFQLLTPNPTAGENIQIYYSGCDAPAPNLFTGEYYYVQQDNDVVSVVVSMAPGIPTCPFGYDYHYDVGGLPIGNYQIDVYVVSVGSQLPIDLNFDTPVDSYQINVIGGPSPVPATSFWSLVLLMVLVLGLAFYNQRQREL